MSASTPFHWISAAAILAFGLAIGLHGPAAAQSKKAAPVVASTFDVCEDSVTGNWRYSGVVSMPGADDASAISVDYWVQNQTSREGYRSVYKANKGGNGGAAMRSGEATVVPFSLDAPALSLGTLRSEVRVQAADAKSALIQQELTQAVCGCGPTGCVRSQGYWGNKPDVAWPNSWYREMNFYSSSLNWQQLYDRPVRGNAYIMLAHQFMTAVLNRNAGASAPLGVQDVMAKARDWFASGATLDTCGKGECQEQKAWAAILDVYNNGDYPGAPRHCTD